MEARLETAKLDRDAPSPADPLRALVVANPVAPHADPQRLDQALRQVLRAGGGRFRIVETTSADDIVEQIGREIERAALEGCDLVIAAGGDGTISTVATSLSRRPPGAPPMLLGIVPMGTANVLAHELAIPIDIEAAVAVAVERCRVVGLDAIACDDRWFLTQVGVGLDAGVIGETSRQSQQRFKRLAYFMTLVRMAAGHRSHRFLIDVDGRRLRVDAWQVVLANAGTFGTQPFRWGPGINPTDGVLDLCIYDVRRFADSLGLLWTLLRGRHRRDPRVRILQVRNRVTIDCDVKLPIQGDGEIIGDTPMTLGVARSVVGVVVSEPPEKVALEQGGHEASRTHSAQLRPAAVPSPGQTISRRARSRIAQQVLLHQITTLAAIDTALFLKINGAPAHDRIDRILSMASRLLDHGEAWVVLALAAAVADPARHARVPWEVIPSLWLTMLAVNFPIKSLFGRRRPFVSYVKARVVGRRPLDSSFPSGHTAAAFAGALLLTPVLPWLAPLFYAYALVVAFSRIYLGVHYPSDVVIGAGIGSLLALVLGTIARAVVPG